MLGTSFLVMGENLGYFWPVQLCHGLAAQQITAPRPRATGPSSMDMLHGAPTKKRNKQMRDGRPACISQSREWIEGPQEEENSGAAAVSSARGGSVFS